MAGWIKLHRKTLESQVFSDSELFRLWCYLLLRASFKTSWFRGVEIKRGQVAFSYRVLSDALGYSRGKLERSMKKLETMGSIRIKAGRDFSVATICNYESYQSDDESMRDAGEAADRAVDKSAAGPADKAVNGAVYKKEIIQEPPPPTSSVSVVDDEAWRAVEDDLLSAGVRQAKQAITAAIEHRCSIDDVKAVIAYWRGQPGAWDGGALFDRIVALRTGQKVAALWPLPHQAFARRQQPLVADRTVEKVKAANALARDVNAAAKSRAADLDRIHGATLDSFGDDQLRELFVATFGEFAWNHARKAGKISTLDRAALLEVIASGEAVA